MYLVFKNSFFKFFILVFNNNLSNISSAKLLDLVTSNPENDRSPDSSLMTFTILVDACLAICKKSIFIFNC